MPRVPKSNRGQQKPKHRAPVPLERKCLKFHRSQHGQARTVLRLIDHMGSTEHQGKGQAIWAKMAVQLEKLDIEATNKLKPVDTFEIKRFSVGYSKHLLELCQLAEEVAGDETTQKRGSILASTQKGTASRKRRRIN